MSVLLLWSALAGAQSAETSPDEAPPIAFETYRSQNRSYKGRLGSYGHIVDPAVRGSDKRLVAVTPEGPLMPADFARAVGDDRRGDRIETLTRASNTLLALQFGTLIPGLLLTSLGDGASPAGLGLVIASIPIGITGIVTSVRRNKIARYDIEEAEAAIRPVTRR